MADLEKENEALRKRVGELEVERDRMKEALELARSQVDGNTYGRTKTLAVIDAALVPPYLGWSNTRAEQAEAQLEAYKVEYPYNEVDLDMAVELEQTLRKNAEAQLAVAREALGPFARAANNFDQYGNESIIDLTMKVTAVRKARVALQQTAPATVESTSPDSA